MNKGPQDQSAGEMDNHDQPTEPIPRLVLSPDVATVPGGVTPDEQVTVPAMPGRGQIEQEPPYQHRPVYPTLFPVLRKPAAPKADRYPYLPADQPGAGMVVAPPASPVYPTNVAQPQAKTRARLRRSPVPVCIGLCFVAIQFLLLARFVLKLINLALSTGWDSPIYALSDVFVQPFQTLLPQFTATTLLNIEVDTLLAILVYGFVSRILVHGLKLVMHSR